MNWQYCSVEGRLCAEAVRQARTISSARYGRLPGAAPPVVCRMASPPGTGTKDLKACPFSKGRGKETAS